MGVMTCKLQSNDTLSSYPFSQFQLCVIMPRIYNSLFKNKVIIITIVLCMISSYRQLDLRTHHRTSSRVTTLKPPWLSQPRFVGSAAASASWNDWTENQFENGEVVTPKETWTWTNWSPSGKVVITNAHRCKLSLKCEKS